MGSVDLKEIKRSEVHDLIDKARIQKKSKESLVRAQLAAKYPELTTTTIVRNGHRYVALDYLIGDLSSYG